MKRHELRVGMAVAYGSENYPHGPAIVIDTRPWRESTEYHGRFGTMKTGRFYQEPGAPGVAVAEYDRGWGGWRPGVVALSNIRRTWAQEEERRAVEAIAKVKTKKADEQYKRRVAHLPSGLNAEPVYHRGNFAWLRHRVEVDLSALEAWVDESRREP